MRWGQRLILPGLQAFGNRGVISVKTHSPPAYRLNEATKKKKKDSPPPLQSHTHTEERPGSYLLPSLRITLYDYPSIVPRCRPPGKNCCKMTSVLSPVVKIKRGGRRWEIIKANRERRHQHKGRRQLLLNTLMVIAQKGCSSCLTHTSRNLAHTTEGHANHVATKSCSIST